MQADDQDELSADELAEAFRELLEATKAIDETAQSLVQAIRTMTQHRARYEPVEASDFPERDLKFYNGIANELTALGFEILGDFEDAALILDDPSKKSFVRFALGAHGAIAAMWFEVPQDEILQCLVVHSWLDDGRTMVTTRGVPDTGIPHPAHIILVEEADADLDTRAVVRRHGERVATSGRAPRRLTGVADLFASHSGDELKIAQFREAQGTALFEPWLRSMLGENYEEEGEPILDAIRRHPEWMRGEITNEPRSFQVRAVRGGDVDAKRFPHLVIARIPEHIEPIDRGERYEEPLQDALAIRDLGLITGGGSQLTATTEIGFVDIELALVDLNGALDVAKRILEEAGAPVGSQFLLQRNGADEELPFGVQEVLALYVDGVNLPDEVYEQLDFDDFTARLSAAAESVGGESRSIWSGPTETAFYHYGPSAEAMLEALRPVLEAQPVCQNARIVIRQGADGGERTIRLPGPNGA
jgi:hypothetical protein